jgi:hypothetical protein
MRIETGMDTDGAIDLARLVEQECTAWWRALFLELQRLRRQVPGAHRVEIELRIHHISLRERAAGCALLLAQLADPPRVQLRRFEPRAIRSTTDFVFAAGDDGRLTVGRKHPLGPEGLAARALEELLMLIAQAGRGAAR